MLIEVNNLTHVYATRTSLERKALADVSLKIQPGESVGIAGQTGSGKSTLVQHLAGLLEPTSGQVLLDGVVAHVRTSAAQSKRHHIGIAFQYPEEQFFKQTVFQEVAFGPRNLGLKGTRLEARVSSALKLVGLSPQAFLSRCPFALSGGEMRRVALASVLAMRPEVLILDEPTAGLDTRGRRDLLDHVATWREDTGHTLILISHDLGILPRVVDRVLLLCDGRIEGDGSTRTILGDPERLGAAGLKPPAPVALLQTLKRAGWPVRTDRLLAHEAAREIAAAHSLSRTSGEAVGKKQ